MRYIYQINLAFEASVKTKLLIFVQSCFKDMKSYFAQLLIENDELVNCEEFILRRNVQKQQQTQREQINLKTLNTLIPRTAIVLIGKAFCLQHLSERSESIHTESISA